MDPCDKLLNRITAKLEVDRELQMEVASELRCHIADKASELRASGLGEVEALDQACNALGEPDDLAEQLWQANRIRIGIRGTLRWAARVALIPAAIVVVFAIASGMAGENWTYGLFPTSDFTGTSTFKLLPEEQRYILVGDPGATDDVAKAKSISDRWPDDPVYYGHYATWKANSQWNSLRRLSPQSEEAEMKSWLDLYERGRQVDPENAFYDIATAALLAQCAGKVSEDQERAYVQVDSQGREKSKPIYRFNLARPERFELAVESLREGLAKEEFSCRSAEMLDLRLSILPEAERFSDFLRRLQWRWSFLLPGLNQYRNLAKALCARSVALAERGEQDEALMLVDQAKSLASKIGARGSTLIELLVAQAIQTLALAHERHVWVELGMPEQAEGALREFDRQNEAFNNARNAPRWFDQEQQRQAGLLWANLLPHFSEPMDFEPMRSAEKALFQQLGLLVLLGFLVAAALLNVAVVGYDLIRRDRRRVGAGLLLFVGWRRIGMICLFAIVLPLAAYVVYSYGLTRSDHQYGLNYTAGKVLSEVGLTVAAVLVLLRATGYAAVRARAAEISLAVPAPIRLRNRPFIAVLGVLSFAPSIVYLIGWRIGYFRPTARNFADVVLPGLALSGALLAFLLIWRVREANALRDACNELIRFRRTLRRSMVPILAAAVILVGAVCGWSLANMEKSAISRVRGQAAWDWRDEMERSTFGPLKERFVRMEQARKTLPSHVQ